MVEELALLAVQTGHQGHLLIGQVEVENVEILLHTGAVHALGNDHDPPLQQPPQNHLTVALPIAGADGSDGRGGENPILPLSERSPGLGGYPLPLQEGDFLLLLEPGGDLDLIDRRLDLGHQFQVLDLVCVEVGDPDGADLPGLLGLFQGLPSSGDIPVRLVEQVEFL